MDPNPSVHLYPARRESQSHQSQREVARSGAPARPDRSRSRGGGGGGGATPVPLPQPLPPHTASSSSVALLPKSPRRPISSSYAAGADSSSSTSTASPSSTSTTILSPVPSSASSTLFSPRPASAMVPLTCIPSHSSAGSPSLSASTVAPSPMPMPRRSLPDVLSPPLDDAQLYPYVLRAALWHDRSKLAHGMSLHGGGPMTAYVRQLFGVPNDKAKDPAYASVKSRSDDKHLYRDLNLYLDRLDLNLIPGRRHDDFPAPKCFSAWLNAEREAVLAQARSLVARDSKVSKKSKHGTPNPRTDPCIFIPPHSDDAFACILRKLVAFTAPASPTGDSAGGPMGSAGWPTDESARALIDLLETRWRIDPAYRALLLLDRTAMAQLVQPPKSYGGAGGTCSPQALRDIDAHLDQVMHLARTSVARWPTAHRALAQRTLVKIAAAATDRIQHYPEFYQRVHFVPAMAGLVQLVSKSRLLLTHVTADIAGAGAAPVVPDPLPRLRHAAYVHFRRVLHKAHEESVAQLALPPDGKEQPEPLATDDPRLVMDRILLACDFILHDIDKLKRVLATNSPTANSALGWAAAHAVLVYELLSKLVAHIDEYWVKPQDGAACAVAKVFDAYNTVVRVVDAVNAAREEALALGVISGTSRGNEESMAHLLARYADWFQTAVDDWIQRTSDTMTEQWTRRMIEQDQFVALNGPSSSSTAAPGTGTGDMLSTSVIDLFSAFHQQVDALKALAWPSFDHEYRAAKKFTRTMCATLTRYADYIQGQVIAILLQMEEAALAEDAAIEAANAGSASGSGASSTHASPDRTKSLMHRLRGAFGGDKDKDRSVAGKVTRRIRTPTKFDEPLCVRLNNLYAAKRRIDGLYAHLTGVLSNDLPDDLYVSPFARDETVVGMSQVYVELDPRRAAASGMAVGGPDVFWAEVTLDGTPLGRTPTEEGILRAPGHHPQHGSGRSGSPRPTTPPPPVMIDLDAAVLVPGTSTVMVQLTVYASMLDGETVTAAIRSSTSMVPTAEERLGLAKGGLIVGMCNASIDVRDVHSPEGVSKTYPVQLTGASQWATGKHHIGQRRLRVHVRWVRGESRYMYHFFDDAYSQLSVMVDNGLLMMASQVGKWMQDYMLQLVKQYKIASMAKAFGGLPGDAATEHGGSGGGVSGGESTIVSFKTRAGRKTITFATVEEDMQPLLDYLNHTLEVLNTHLHDSLTTKLFKRVWRGALTSIEWQLTGRRDKRTSKWKSLDIAQVAVLRRALTLLYDFFHVDGEGLPRTLLQSRHYHRLAALLSYYHANTDDLMGMYQSAINSYLSAKVEGLTKRAQRQVRSRQSTLTRGASLANFAKLADLSTGPQASDVSPIHSPFASTKDINEVASTMARSGMTGLAPGKDMHVDCNVRQRKFKTLRPGSARAAAGVSAKDFIAGLAADEPSRKRNGGAGKKERRFQNAMANAASDSDSDDGSDHPFGDEDEDATSIGAPLYTDSGVGFVSERDRAAGSRVVSPVDSEAAQAQAEFKLASLARQEAIWTILCLRADVGDLECRDFVTEQAAVVRRILDNMRDEATNMLASSGQHLSAGGRAPLSARGGY